MTEHPCRPVSTSTLERHLSRRRFLGLTGVTAAGAGLVLVGCGSDAATAPSSQASTTTPGTSTDPEIATASTRVSADTAVEATANDVSSGTPSSTVFTAADFAALGACRVLPELTQGPFPSVTQLERRDVTEGLDGYPLRVGVQVVDEACTPIPGAVVEIWHCDIDGDYSAYADGYTDDDAGEGTTFFRGFQTANDDGIVEFFTRHPGWYQGRAVHIHAKVHIGDATTLTTQFLFDDAVNSAIFTEPLYVGHGAPDTINADDGVTGGQAAEDGLIMSVSDDAAVEGSRALIVVGVDPSATSSAGGGAGGPMGGGPSRP